MRDDHFSQDAARNNKGEVGYSFPYSCQGVSRSSAVSFQFSAGDDTTIVQFLTSLPGSPGNDEEL